MRERVSIWSHQMCLHHFAPIPCSQKKVSIQTNTSASPLLIIKPITIKKKPPAQEQNRGSRALGGAQEIMETDMKFILQGRCHLLFPP